MAKKLFALSSNQESMINIKESILSKLKKIPLSNFSFWFIIFFPVFVDLANGFLLSKNLNFLSIGILYRTFLFLSTFIFIGLIRKKILLFYTGILAILFFLLNVFWFLWADKYSLIHEVQFFIKILLPWALLSFFLFFNRKKEIEINRLINYVVYFGFVASFALIFSFITGLGMEAYQNEEYSFGIKSYFIAINDIGLAILISYIFALYIFFKNFNWYNFLKCAVILSGLILLTSRAATLGALGCTFLFLISIIFFKRNDVNLSRVTKTIVVISFMACFIAGVFQLYQVYQKYNYLINKFEKLLEESPRHKTISLAQKRIKDRSWVLNLTGESFLIFSNRIAQQYDYKLTQWTKSEEVGKLVEQDYYDLMGSYGYILGILVMLFPLALLLKMAWIFLGNRTLINFAFLLAICIFMLHSFLAGHALISSTVATLIVVVYFYIITYRPVHKEK